MTLAFLGRWLALIFRPLALARRAARHPAPPLAERRAPALRVLHDLRPADHARLARRAASSSRCSSRSARGRAVPSSSAPTACSGRSPSARSPCRCSTGCCPATRYQLARQRRGTPRHRRGDGTRLMNRSPPSADRSPPRSRLLAVSAHALAFCGFYVAKADTKLFNKASQVVLVRDDDKTVLTMANDFQGDPKEFAIVVPVPTFLERGPDPRRRTRRSSSISTPTPRRGWSSISMRIRAQPRSATMPMAPAQRIAPSAGRWRRRARQEPRRENRGAIHRRRIRHPDPLGRARATDSRPG